MAKFLTFTFDGVNSSEYNVYVVNEGDSISLPSSPSFTDQTASPLYQNTTYYLGTSISTKTFTLNCIAKDITLQMYQEMIRWLNIEKVGKLVLDSSPYFYSTVKISSFSETSLLSDWDSVRDTYHMTFSLRFTTVGDYAQQNLNPYYFNLDLPYTEHNYHDPMYGLPMVWYDNKEKSRELKNVYIVNYNSLPMYLQATIGPTTSFAVWKHNNLKMEYKGTWNAKDNIATTIVDKDKDITKQEPLSVYPVENNVYYKVTDEGFFNYRNYAVGDIIIARNGEWFKETESTLCDELFYNYDMINFSSETADGSEKDLWTWTPYNIELKSQYGFITDKETNQLIEIVINEQLERLEEYKQFKGIPEYFNNGILQIEPNNFEIVPVAAKMESTPRVHASKRDYWMKLTFPDTLKVCQTELVNGKPKITETKSFIYITYSEADENGDYSQKIKYIEILKNERFKMVDDGLEYYMLKEEGSTREPQEYKDFSNLLSKTNIKVSIVNVQAGVIKFNSILTAKFMREITLNDFPKFIGGASNYRSTLYMMGFETYNKNWTNEQLHDSDVEYLYYNTEEEKWGVSRTYARAGLTASGDLDYKVSYETNLADAGWTTTADPVKDTYQATEVETKGRTFIEEQEEFNQNFLDIRVSGETRSTVKCKIVLPTTPKEIKEIKDEKQPTIYSNCFDTIKPNETEKEGMYFFQGNIYIHVKKSRLGIASFNDDEQIRFAVEKILKQQQCFFLYEVDRYFEVLSDNSQLVLSLSAELSKRDISEGIDQFIYGHSQIAPNSKAPSLDSTKRTFTSSSANTFTLEQIGSTIELDLKLRNQF